MENIRHESSIGIFSDHVSRRRTLGYGSAALAAVLARTMLPPSVAGQEMIATPAAAEPPSWEAIDQQLAGIAPTTALLMAELIDGTIEPVHAFNTEEFMPIASSFKLWILGALSKQVEAGTLDWEQMVEIQDQYRSVPGGDLRYVEAGTQFSLRYLAERMMQKSDNTATDHMLFLAGRENVEQAMSDMGHSDPARNIPMLSTREFSMIKFAYPTDKVDAYIDASVEERRQILAGEVAEMPYEVLVDIDQTAPIEIDRIEWFATREDLARTMSWLLVESQKPGLRQVAEIMALETQLPFDGEIWPYVGFKGGSEFGVLSGTWLLQRADGRHFCYTIGFRNPEAGIDITSATEVMMAARDRLAQTP